MTTNADLQAKSPCYCPLVAPRCHLVDKVRNPMTGHDLPARDKRLIFTVTTGRSGTLHLAFCLDLFARVDARHEPRPSFSGAFRAVQSLPGSAKEFWTRTKLPRIARSREPIYAETSHLVCKGFLEDLIELGYRPDLIHLHRPPRAVSLSLWRLDTIPGRTLRGTKYYLGPEDPGVLPIRWPAGRTPHDYQLCFWYCLEIARRARAYTERFGPLGVAMHRVELRDLADLEGVRSLGKALELGPLGLLAPLRFRFFRTGARNDLSVEKRERTLSTPELEELEEEVRDRIRAAGAAVPDTEAEDTSPMEPKQISDENDLADSVAAPTFLLFKHSLICPVSTRAFSEYRSFLEAAPGTPTAWLDVVGQRPLSRSVADTTGVQHESPQALLFAGGKVVWHASHAAITRESLEQAVASYSAE